MDARGCASHSCASCQAAPTEAATTHDPGAMRTDVSARLDDAGFGSAAFQGNVIGVGAPNLDGCSGAGGGSMGLLTAAVLATVRRRRGARFSGRS